MELKFGHLLIYHFLSPIVSAFRLIPSFKNYYTINDKTNFIIEINEFILINK